MNGDTHQTGTVNETGLVGYVHRCSLIQEARVDYRNFCILLIDTITRVNEFTRGFQEPQCELDVCEPVTQVRAKGDGHRVEGKLFISWGLGGRN